MGNKPTKPAVKINFKEHFKIQKQTIFNKEVTKGAKPVKGRMMQSGHRDSLLPHINHETLEKHRLTDVQVNNEDIEQGNLIRNPKFSHQAYKKGSSGALVDNRTKAKFNEYPFTCVGLLQVQFQNRKIRGTAFLISSNWLLTCAHNFYDRKEGKMGTSATLTLGLHERQHITRENGKEIREKIDVGDVIQISTWRLPDMYMNCEDEDEALLYDFALVKLKNFYDLEQKYGYFGLDSVWAQKMTSGDSQVIVAGFPNESKGFPGKCKALMEGRGPWTEVQYETEVIGGNNLAFVNYKVFTSPGQSGSPIFYETKEKEYYMIGIHTMGGDDLNSGVLITPKARELVNGWIEEMKTIFDISNQNIGDEGMEHFIDNFKEISTKITELQLANNRIGPLGIAKLMVPKWNNLKLLNLENNNIKLEGAKRLGDPSNGWNNLTYLNINNTLIGDEGCCRILQNREWVKLKELHLKSCCITTVTINEMIKNEWISLQTLHLGSNDLKYEDIRLLFSLIPADEKRKERRRFENLRHLNLTKNPIGNNGLQVIVSSGYNLQSLNITDIGINPVGMEILARRKWDKLKKLHIDWNKTVSIEGIKNVTPEIYPSLTVLKLDWTTLGGQGVKEFMRHEWKTLKNLSLNNNYLGDSGLNKLQSHGTLQVLVLERNNITTQGVKEFVSKQQWRGLMQLKLRSNHIKKQGFKEIIEKLRNLNHLDINNNGLDAHEKRELKQLANRTNPNLHIEVDMGEEADYST